MTRDDRQAPRFPLQAAGLTPEQINFGEDGLRNELSGLSDLMAEARDMGEVLADVAASAVQVIPGADGVGITALHISAAKLRVQAWEVTAPFVREIDILQYVVLNDGPCISCMQERRPVVSRSLGTDVRWPRFSERTTGMGISAALSLPLLVGNRVVGSINCYARESDAFGQHAVDLGLHFAGLAAVSVYNAQLLAGAQQRAQHLQTALNSRQLIDQAVGVILTRSGATAEEAFDQLRTISQFENAGITQVARGIVDQAGQRVQTSRSRHPQVAQDHATKPLTDIGEASGPRHVEAGLVRPLAVVEPHTSRLRNHTLALAASGVSLAPTLQPIVSLPSGTVVGFEALARWPALNDPSPSDVLAYASASGLVDWVDRLCTHAAISTALSRGLPKGALLGINCEPESDSPGPLSAKLLTQVRGELNIMFELTERGLFTCPQALLAKVAGLRANGFLIALDDVGAHPDSLALLDVVAPDVIKLDLHLVQAKPSRDQARILAAVWAHHERTGATILAEGIETDQHLQQALAYGASLGQGYKYRSWERVVAPAVPLHSHRSHLVAGSPFDLLTARTPLRTGRKETLTSLSRHIEEQARHTADPPIVLTALQHTDYFTDETRRRYLDLSETCPFVAIFGEHLPRELGPNIRGVPLAPTDPLCREWIVLAVGPQLAVALIAHEHDDQSIPRFDADRRFDFAITYDRLLVTAVARNLLDHIAL